MIGVSACRTVSRTTFGVLLLWLACIPAAKAQQLAFNHLTVENGLLSNSVLSIAQYQQGFLWFGTSIGLTRYDGARFNIYKSIGKDTQSLSSNNITTLYRDAQNNLWIGTSGGLDRYDPKTDAFERIWINGKRMGNIYSIIQDKQQRLWVGSTQGLHLLTDPGKRNFQSFYPSADSNNSIAGNIIRALHEDHRGAHLGGHQQWAHAPAMDQREDQL